MRLTMLFDNAVIYFVFESRDFLSKGVISVKPAESVRCVKPLPLFEKMLSMNVMNDDVIVAGIRAVVPLTVSTHERVGIP